MESATRVRHKRGAHQPWRVTWVGPKRIPRTRRFIDCEQVAAFLTRIQAEQFAREHDITVIIHVDHSGVWQTPYPVRPAGTEE